MVTLKISSFVFVYAVILFQACYSDAAPARTRPEDLTDTFVLMNYEAQRLLSALVKNVLWIAKEREATRDDPSRAKILSKRCSNLSTCVLGKLSQELLKLQTFPQTDVGAGTPGKKRSVIDDKQFMSYKGSASAS